ncbi:MAG: helix-hairpin-helix domain-containing protein [Actinomycetota bacterium]|nr:MAG: competence protein [Actinomycetota bacterium]MDO8948952.1 helix-hairpin-helix domain-containing protein [Actinomycetota bacterium]MDP3630637.1 helix-hairpin-helix domain-containing protein [Actinomycetota bacterium]TPW10252.1 MAG: competence protein ComEA [Acidimicrobiaceae bacterium]
MHFEVPEKIRDLLKRAGLGGLSDSAVLVIACLAVVVLALGVWRFWPSSTGTTVEVVPEEIVGTTPAAAEATAPAEVAVVVVHVVGAVQTPGLYTLPGGSRVGDALTAAGGVTPEAAGESVNLARVLADGEQVFLPTKKQVAAGVVAPPGAVGASTGGGTTAGGKIDLNRATAADLDTLPGVGPSTAKKIVDDRTKNGPFKKIEDLMRVTGIGQKKFESLRDLVTVG